MNNQIYWSVVYDHNKHELMLGQFPLAKTIPYEKRVELVKAFDKRAKDMNFEQVRFGYYNVPEFVPDADNSLPF